MVFGKQKHPVFKAFVCICILKPKKDIALTNKKYKKGKRNLSPLSIFSYLEIILNTFAPAPKTATTPLAIAPQSIVRSSNLRSIDMLPKLTCPGIKNPNTLNTRIAPTTKRARAIMFAIFPPLPTTLRI